MTKCCDITAGQLRHLVTIEKRVRTADGQGGYTETWTADPVGGVRVGMQFLTGTERWEAHRNHPGNLIRLTMRFKADVNGTPYWQPGTHRVIFRTHIYDITAVSDIEWMQKWIKMDIFESSPS